MLVSNSSMHCVHTVFSSLLNVYALTIANNKKVNDHQERIRYYFTFGLDRRTSHSTTVAGTNLHKQNYGH